MEAMKLSKCNSNLKTILLPGFLGFHSCFIDFVQGMASIRAQQGYDRIFSFRIYAGK